MATTSIDTGKAAIGRTLYDKIWDEHVVHTEEDGTSILYIDRHLVHEVTSPQAFEVSCRVGDERDGPLHRGEEEASGDVRADEARGAGDERKAPVSIRVRM